MAWVEALLTKVFIEDGASDVEGFKALERSFSNQHRGQQSHSHFMRPLCQTTPRAPKAKIDSVVDPSIEPTPPTIIINGRPDSNGAPRTPSRNSTFREENIDPSKPQSRNVEKDHTKSTPKEKGKKAQIKGSKSPKGSETPTKDHPQKSSQRPDKRHSSSPANPGWKDPAQPKANIFTFMPYLHFESTRRRQEMQEAIKRAEIMRSPLCPIISKASTYDEMLIRAHLATSTVSLHVRRTLDQSFYHNIDTESRDHDQVVYRYQLRGKNPEDVDPNIVMVDQLYMW